MSLQPLDFEPSSLDHPFHVGDEFGVYRIVGGSKVVERRSRRGVEDGEHAQVLLSVLAALHPVTVAANAASETRPTASGLAFDRREGRCT